MSTSDRDAPTDTQPRPNISTEHNAAPPASPTGTQPRPNISTEHQPGGDARRPSDVLDRGQDRDGNRPDRKTSLTDND